MTSTKQSKKKYKFSSKKSNALYIFYHPESQIPFKVECLRVNSIDRAVEIINQRKHDVHFASGTACNIADALYFDKDKKKHSIST